jgi:replicative DNA helicase
MSGNVPLHDLDAEMSLLSAMMLAESACDNVRERVAREDFYRQSHGAIYAAMLDMRDRAVPVDPVTVTAELERLALLEKVGGRGRVHELAAWASAASNATHYADIVRDYSTMRRLKEAGDTITRLGSGEVAGSPEELLIEAEKALSLAQGSIGSKEAVPLSEGVAELYATMRRVLESGQPEVGHSTGFASLDVVTQGLWDEQLIIVAARTGQGKSTLAQNIAENFVDRGDATLFVTLEMSEGELLQRSLARAARVDSRVFLNAEMKDAPAIKQKVADARKVLEARQTLFVEASGDQTVNGLRSLAIRYKRQHDIKLMVVDYLQLVTPPKAERHNLAIGEISRSLKMLAKTLRIPIIAVSQLNRDGSKARPELYHLKESGSLEQDADVVIFLHDPNEDDKSLGPTPIKDIDTVEVIVAKNRKGGRGDVKMAYVKKYSALTDLPIHGTGTEPVT